MTKNKGLVAFFDILGYQNFLKNNEPETAADKIAEFLGKLKTLHGEKYLEFLGGSLGPQAKPIVDRIRYLVISDSILVTLEADKGDAKKYKPSQGLFLMFCARLFKELFIYGLPTRGAIEYGEYILVENQMFAGRPIVNAYQSTTKLDLSACQISDSVGDLMPSLWNAFFLKYNTPLKAGEEKELTLLMPLNLEDNDKDEFTVQKISDLRQFVTKSFVAHNKMLSKEVEGKILNTEMFLRYCKTFS